jgi:ATP-dependent exoDNAse (exonuclease V) beta subunit
VQASDPPLVELIRSERKARAAFENQRLLYVAATRAREHLVLSACLDPNKTDIKPIAGTLLAALWPTTRSEFLTALEISAGAGDDEADTETPFDQALHRVDADWQPPLAARLNWTPGLPLRERDVDIEYNWAGMQARRTGTVLHRLLEVVGRVGVEAFSDAQRQRLINKIPQLLKAMGSRDDGLAQTVEVIRDAFERTLDHQTGQWLLSNRHADAECELALGGVIDGQLVNAVVDRTFVDAHGVRWIIDYKSGYHAGAELDEFLAQESTRYQAQLGRYRRLFEQMETRPITTALYLPRHGRLQIV